MLPKAACIQLTSGDDIAANIAQASGFIEQATRQGARFITLPENAFYMGEPGEKNASTPFSTATHPGILASQTLAQKFGVWILVGSIAVGDEATSGKFLNRSVLIDASGNVAAEYDKIHLFDADLGQGERYSESSRFAPGSKAAIAETPLGTLGLSVCYDLRFPKLYRTLAHEGAQILTVPAAFTAKTGEAHWHVLLRARAIENACYVIAPAQCGTHPGNRKTFGHSLIVDPWGKIIADGGTEPGMTLAEIDLAKVEEIRKIMPSLNHDRVFSR